MTAAGQRFATGFDADQLDRVRSKWMEDPHRVRTAADAGHHDVDLGRVDLGQAFLPDDLLELAHDPWF